MKKTINFDRFMQEKNREYITVTVYGEQYQVLAEVPACVPLMMARAEEAGDASGAEVTLAMMKAATLMFGEKTIQKFEKKGMSANDMGQLVQAVFSAIGGSDEDEDEAEELDDEASKHTISGDPHAKK